MFLSCICVLANIFILSASAACTDNCPEAQGTKPASSTEQYAATTLPGGCILPEHPKHGSYDSPMCQPDTRHPACLNKPGTAVPPSWILRYTCNDSYDLTTTGSEYSVCDHGIWLHRMDCIRLCPPLQSRSVEVECVLADVHVPCDRPMKAKTTATARCKRHYVGPEESRLLCEDTGQWSHHLFNCTPANAVANSVPGSSPDVQTPSQILTLGCRLPEPPQQGSYTSPLCRPRDTKSACHGGPNVPVPHNWLLKYRCHTDYVLSSNSQYSVCDNGVWHNPLRCVPDPALSSNATNLVKERRKRQTICSNKQYICDNDQCIPTPSLCNGKRDCADGSDENSDVCRFNRCASKTFQCTYGACVDSSLRCDGKRDCADGSDESGCSATSGVSECTFGKLQCDNNQCVDLSTICDGTRDCSDGSDETEELCKLITCPAGRFQCKYGACLEMSVRCDGHKDCPDSSDEQGCSTTTGTATANRPLPLGNKPSVGVAQNGDCILPQHPTNGMYVSAHCIPGDSQPVCQDKPGTAVPPNWLLRYMCNDNYSFSSGDSAFAVCNNGVWDNLQDCIKTCPPLVSLSLNIKCRSGGQEVPCERPMKPGTTAETTCKQHYREVYKPQYSRLTCRNTGSWSYRLSYCTPVCGVSVKTTPLEPLIKDGTPTQQGDFPWLTALYMKNSSGLWDQQCGGTLITPHIVLTAAHCVTDKFANRFKPADLKVGLGKYYRDYYKNEQFSKIVDVREVLSPQSYTGLNSYYALDIGLLDLVSSVQVTGYIMPACVDWNPTTPLSPGDVGTVAGWGTTESETSSDTILSTQLTYEKHVTCLRDMGIANRGYLTTDKFCAKILTGGSVARGDSGGGLTFLKDGLHFVFGVVSTRVLDILKFSLFTDVTNPQHIQWLDRSRTALDEAHSET